MSVLVILTLAIAVGVGYVFGWVFVAQLILVAIVAALAAGGGWRWFYVAAATVKRDLIALSRFIKLLIFIKRLQRQNASVGEVFSANAAKKPDKACLIFEDKTWTYKEVEEYSHRIANLFRSHGYSRGQVVGLLLENKPEFVCVWLGLSRLGVVVPLINYNQKHSSLLHSITVANCNALIFGSELSESVSEISPELSSSVSLYRLGESGTPSLLPQATHIDPLLANTSPTPYNYKDNSSKKEGSTHEKPGHHDKLLYIYTSGTTGLPKAAVITHNRYLYITASIAKMVAFKQSDIFYCPLPLYHTAGGIMNVGQAVVFGATVVIRKKFSASQYFSDCAKYNCTVAQYIGEMCRYVLAVPPGPQDRAHKLRMVFGNGLRPQIWPQFVERFGIPRISEFYGATEGNANIVNIDNTPGAIGFISRIIPQVYPISIIKADAATGEPIRGPNGLCQLCKPDEAGVFIGKIIKGNPTRAFLGYVDKKASEKKVVKDVFSKGDSAFLSGDIVSADKFGYLYFKDRTGDTYRWKGENVSTSEVEGLVSNTAGYRDTVVYGVEIPGLEGRAGMAAILDAGKTIDMNDLAAGICKTLPVYARPIFVRLLTEVDMTGTYKIKKVDLQQQGFDPTVIKDSLYYLTSKAQYAPLTTDVYHQICTGQIRF